MIYLHRTIEHNTKAASNIVPLLIKMFKVDSIIDVGCGLGTWLKIFNELGIEDYLGVDGDYINLQLLQIPQSKLLIADLERDLEIKRKFSLVLCLEVAEHLSQTRAASFIKDLTKLGDRIIFSGAIPYQGGQNHLNEQYPDYWISYFKDENFQVQDSIRPLIWNNNEVDWWYRQNILVFEKNLNANSNYCVNPLITKELYINKLSEIEKLKLDIQKIEKGSMRFKYYITGFFNRLKNRYLKLL
jgi:SAM-dependent methyltransferase